MRLTCSFDDITSTTAIFAAEFTGGDKDYTGWRMVKLIITDPNSTTYSNENIIVSNEKGGEDCTFTSVIRGLKPDKEYSWTAEIGFGPSDTDFEKITWLGYLDEESGSKHYTEYGNLPTSTDGVTDHFTAFDTEITKYSINFYASFSYDDVWSELQYLDRLTVIYTTDPSRQTGTSVMTFFSTSYSSTGDNTGIYEWDGDGIAIGGLKAGTTYYWTAFCGPANYTETGIGYIQGETETLPPEPNALSVKILPFSPTEAVLTAVYSDAETSSLGLYSVLYYKFSTDGGTTWGVTRTCTGVVDSENHFVLFKTLIQSLSPNTKYVFRAYVGQTDPWG